MKLRRSELTVQDSDIDDNDNKDIDDDTDDKIDEIDEQSEPKETEEETEHIDPGVNIDENFFLESIDKTFNIIVFMEEMLIHILVPFSIVFSRNLVAHGFSNISLAILSNYVIPCFLVVMTVAYLLMFEFAKDDYDYWSGMYVYPLLFNCIYRATIAVKYASFSKSEYKKFFSCKDSKVIGVLYYILY